MSRNTIALLFAFAAFAGAASAQLLSGPPGNNPPPPPPVPAAPPTVVAQAAAPAPANQDPKALVFDAESKDYNAKPGEASASFTFNATNASANDVLINSLRTSCGCTVAQLPSTPYTLHPGSNVPISVTVDLRGKMGLITKSISVDSTAGFKSLLVKVNIPQPTNTAPPAVAGATASQGMDRAKNIQVSLADPQAVFKGDCAKCHVEKGIGKLGKELYTADCAICHDDEHRAAMVPDLKVPRTHRDLTFYSKWIAEGKAGTLMPAFSASHGGPLTEEQIDSLAIYLYQTLPKDPPAQQARAALPPPPLPTPAAPVPQKN